MVSGRVCRIRQSARLLCSQPLRGAAKLGAKLGTWTCLPRSTCAPGYCDARMPACRLSNHASPCLSKYCCIAVRRTKHRCAADAGLLVQVTFGVVCLCARLVAPVFPQRLQLPILTGNSLSSAVLSQSRESSPVLSGCALPVTETQSFRPPLCVPERLHFCRGNLWTFPARHC